jgi:hypothetical protein
VEVGSKSRCTPVVKRNKNPSFDPTDTFLFTLPEVMRRSGGYVRPCSAAVQYCMKLE